MIKLARPLIPETTWVAETAVIRGDVTLGEHVSVWFGAVLRGDEAPIVVGAETNIQDGAVLHVSNGAPCRIGRQVTIGHRAIVHGCTVADGALIGMGAIVLDGAHIGTGAIVGAGAVVPPGMIVPPESMVLGVPARITGQVTPAQKKLRKQPVENYLVRKEAYRRGQF
jgi:carbonic anhydrase/acetyltransferase-like protein (isoleucine patch superfamily)